MKRRNDAFNNSVSWHHLVTITTLVVSLICFVLFYTTINKMNSEIEAILNISFMKTSYLEEINNSLISQRFNDNATDYKKELSGLYNEYVRNIFKSPVSDAIKYEEEHFAENVLLKSHSINESHIYNDINTDDRKFTILAKNLLNETKLSYKRQLIILIFIPTLMALFRSIQAIYYFYSLRALRGNYMIDALTGVHNRRYMSTLKERENICYIFAIDIDDFKSVNDNFGHAFGDRVLQECARCMKSHIRDHDVVLRMGGDEFSIFLFKTDNVGAKTAANRLLNTINELKLPLPEGKNFTPSLSIGIAKCDGNVEKAMIQADQNLYFSKKSGKNSFTFNEEK